MTTKRKWIAWTLGVLGLCATLSAAGAMSDAIDAADANGAVEQGDGFWRRAHARHTVQRRAVLRMIQKLGLSDAQCGLALQEARNAEPIVANARREAARILVDSERAHASDAREELKSLRQRTMTELEPLARQFLATLTPAQHDIIAAAAARRGQTVDEERLVRRTARALARPMTAALLEARLRH